MVHRCLILHFLVSLGFYACVEGDDSFEERQSTATNHILAVYCKLWGNNSTVAFYQGQTVTSNSKLKPSPDYLYVKLVAFLLFKVRKYFPTEDLTFVSYGFYQTF